MNLLMSIMVDLLNGFVSPFSLSVLNREAFLFAVLCSLNFCELDFRSIMILPLLSLVFGII